MSDDGKEKRTRTVTWEDPHALAEAGRGLSGLEYLQKIIAGELPRPPISALMDFGLTELSEGRAVFTVEPAEYHYNPIGVVHGGLAATLLDSAMGCAVQSMLPAGAGYTTLEIKVNYVRPYDDRDGARALRSEGNSRRRAHRHRRRQNRGRRGQALRARHNDVHHLQVITIAECGFRIAD